MPKRIPRVMWYGVRTLPWLVDVLFGTKLFVWGLADAINPDAVIEQRAWHMIWPIARQVGVLCAVLGAVQVGAGFSRNRLARTLAAMLVLWAFWGLTYANSSQSGRIAYGMDGIGELLILCGIM